MLAACASVAALTSAAGCHRPASAQAPGSAIVRQFETCWGYWNAARWDQLATCYAPDAVSEEPGSGRPPASGRDAIVARAKLLKAAFPDMNGEPLVELVDDNHLVSIVLVHGTQTGPLATPGGVIAPTGRAAGMFVSQVIEVDRAGRVERVALYDDLATLIGQVAPSSGRAVRPPIAALPRHERVAIAADDERERVNASVLPQLLYLLNQHDLAGLDTVLDDDLVWSDAAAPADRDRAGLRTRLAQLWQAMPDLTFQATSLYRAGGYVAIAGTIEGTLQGGTHLVVPYDAVAELEGGKITRSWMFFQGTALGGLR